MDAKSELNWRCRWLIEKFGTVRKSGRLNVTTYANSLVSVECRVDTGAYGPSYLLPALTVRDTNTGVTLMHYVGTHGGVCIEDKEAQSYLPYLRNLMVLEELARA